MNQFTKLAVIGFTALSFTACNSSSSGSSANEVALTELENGGYVVNVSSALLSEDDNFDIYFCYAQYYILNNTGDDIAHSGDVEIYGAPETMNIWSDWPTGENDVDIMTAGTVHPEYVVEGETYDLNWYDSTDLAGSMTINVIDTFDCSTLPIPR